MKKLFAELRRRKVIRVAAIYVVVGWVLVRIVDTLVSPLDLPGSAPTVLLFLLITLFPLAVFMAWALELRPQDGTPTSPDAAGRRVLGVSLAMLIAAVAGWYLLWGPPGAGDPAAQPAVAPETSPTPGGKQLMKSAQPVPALSAGAARPCFEVGIAGEVPDLRRSRDLGQEPAGTARVTSKQSSLPGGPFGW